MASSAANCAWTTRATRRRRAAGSVQFLNPDLRVFVPLAFTHEERAEDRRWSQNHEQLARLAPGVTLDTGPGTDGRAQRGVVERPGR